MEAFEKIVWDLIALFDEFQPLEEEKLEAAKAQDISKVEDCMNREQAMSLKLRGLDNKREAIQKEYGWEGMTFRQILEVISPEQRGRFQPIFDEVENKMTLFQSTNESALEIISLHLRRINQTLEAKGVEYDRDGSPGKPEQPLTSRRV